VLKGILYLLDYLSNFIKCQINILERDSHNTTYTFNFNLVYKTYEHQNQKLVTPKSAPINLVLLIPHNV
jgi:hypothetical protein